MHLKVGGRCQFLSLDEGERDKDVQLNRAVLITLPEHSFKFRRGERRRESDRTNPIGRNETTQEREAGEGIGPGPRVVLTVTSCTC